MPLCIHLFDVIYYLNLYQEPSIAASMATFSAASFIGAANGNNVSTLGTSPTPFASSQATKLSSSSGTTLQAAAHQQHIFHQSLAHQQVRHSLTTAVTPAGSPPSSTQSTSQQHSTMQQAFQVSLF